MDRMSPGEFRDASYLQELNRRFLHPLGLALEVVVDEDGSARFGEVWDCRDDPEGIAFQPELLDREKADCVTRETWERWGPRVEALGYRVQPVP
jgi:hypothetical protein